MFTEYYEDCLLSIMKICFTIFVLLEEDHILGGLLFSKYYEDRPKDGPMKDSGQCLLTIIKGGMDHDQ